VGEKNQKKWKPLIEKKGRFYQKIQFGCMRGLVKEALTSHSVGFNTVKSAPSGHTHRLNRIFDARRGVEHGLQARILSHGH
jgi:hypothetical protein